MAEQVVSDAVIKLTGWLIKEAVLLKGVSEEVQHLRDKLSWMQGFLQDADAVQERSVRFQTLVSQIREVAFDAEVAIESYISKAAARRSWRKVLKPIYRRRIRTKIKKIQARMEEISKDKEIFGTASMNNQEGGEALISKNERLRWWRQPSPNIQEDDLIDLVEDTEALITQLCAMERSRSVVSIVGMGGLGKTTLAKKLYNHPDLGDQFHCRSFVYVSQEFNRREILKKIIKDVGCPHDRDELEKLEEEAMVEMLHMFLKDGRYLVVLDDIWKKEVWDGLKAAFPSGEMGSKVMVTTRFRDVAVYADPRSIPHEPRMLTEDESLELFLKKALPGMDDIPSNLQKLGREMVVKCGGLPLAVIVLGGLLSTKPQTVVEWDRVLQNISWNLISAQDRVSAILALSYNDLPLHLKSCFLHLGIFPEDTSIEKMHLIRLWVAEGFLPQQGEEIEEGVAENCMNQLIDRCMIQVGTRTYLGSFKTIRIHDVLRDFSLTKGREENFLGIYTGQEHELSASHDSTKSRRLAIHNEHDRCVNLDPYTHLRSLHFYCKFDQFIDFTRKNFKSLRVLELYCVDNDPYKGISKVGDLIQLRFLGLRHLIYTLYLSSLKNLQTLDMRFSGYASSLFTRELKIENLRHLLLPERHPFDLTLGTMIHLQTLKGIEGGRWIEDGLAKMISLRRLKIRTLSRDGVTLVISIAERLRHLQSLSLTNKEREDELFPPLEGLSRCDRLLKLRLCGKIEKLPDANGFPRNLIKLVLMRSNLPKGSVVILERLPNLKMLSLGHGSYPFNELVCSSEGFPQLQVLHLIWERMEVWKVEEGALKKLRQLTIYRCSKLKQVPEGLKSLTTLQELDICESPEFEHMLRTNEDLIDFTRKYSIKLVHRYNDDFMKWSSCRH
ncbi:putative disease resistance protein [Rosa sericea]